MGVNAGECCKKKYIIHVRFWYYIRVTKLYSEAHGMSYIDLF